MVNLLLTEVGQNIFIFDEGAGKCLADKPHDTHILTLDRYSCQKHQVFCNLLEIYFFI
jgi:hypothetical protein